MDTVVKVILGQSPMSEFDCHHLFDWTNDNNFIAPIIACLVYVVAIFVVIPRIRPEKPIFARHVFALWNFGLSIFSGVALSVCGPYLIRLWMKQGIHHLTCSDDMMFGELSEDSAWYGPVGFWMSLFMLSKFPELLDTFFLAWMDKPIIFLHWYHHITVLLYAWFAYASATPVAVFMGTMNYTVHTLMYFYFGASVYTKGLSFLRMPITVLQLTQMVFGVVATLMAYYYQEFDVRGCSKRYPNSNFFAYCGLLYFSYFVLFAKLFVDNYIKKKAKASKLTKQA